MTLTNVTATKENAFKSEVYSLRVQFNALAWAVAHMMPGVLLSDPATKAGTTSAKTWRSEAFTFTFRGKRVSAAAQEKAFTATTHDVGASKEAWFVLSVQSNGTTFTITKGADQTIGTQVLPIAPDNEAIVGYLKIVTNAGGLWDASTDDLAATVANVDSVMFVDAKPVQTVNVDTVELA